MNEDEVKPQDLNPPPQAEPAEDFKEKYLRALAEMENMRKRMQKEKQDMARFGIENAIAEFLPAIDNLENALHFAESAHGEVKSWAMGFQMILAQLKEVLHNHGIVAFHSIGNRFDPAYHEAVEIIETEEHPEGAILQEFAKGYKSPTRVIRPARVKVAKQPTKIEAPAPDGAEEQVTQ
jgi:molecular chaperone GrpE